MHSSVRAWLAPVVALVLLLGGMKGNAKSAGSLGHEEELRSLSRFDVLLNVVAVKVKLSRLLNLYQQCDGITLCHPDGFGVKLVSNKLHWNLQFLRTTAAASRRSQQEHGEQDYEHPD